MQLDLTDEEAAALLSLLNRVIADDRYPLSPRITMLRAIRAKLPGAPQGTTAGETADTRRTYVRTGATRWPAAALEDMLCVERRHVDPTGFVAASKPPYAQAAYWQALLASNWD
jgi:hypothetical protein